MEDHSNLPGEEVVHEEDDNRQGHDCDSGQEVEVPAPAKVRKEFHHVALVVPKREEYPRIVYDNDRIGKASQAHDQTSLQHKPSTSTNHKYEEKHRNQVEGKG